MIEQFAERGGSADAKLGMALAEMIGYRLGFRGADASHHEAHRAEFAGNLEPGAAVEHESTLLGPRARK